MCLQALLHAAAWQAAAAVAAASGTWTLLPWKSAAAVAAAWAPTAAPLPICLPLSQQQGGEGKKKETKLGLTASKEGDFGDW